MLKLHGQLPFLTIDHILYLCCFCSFSVLIGQKNMKWNSNVKVSMKKNKSKIKRAPFFFFFFFFWRQDKTRRTFKLDFNFLSFACILFLFLFLFFFLYILFLAFNLICFVTIRRQTMLWSFFVFLLFSIFSFTKTNKPGFIFPIWDWSLKYFLLSFLSFSLHCQTPIVACHSHRNNEVLLVCATFLKLLRVVCPCRCRTLFLVLNEARENGTENVFFK